MARLDLGGLRDLWYRIDDIFARLTEAAGSVALSGTSLVLKAVSGNQLSSVDLNGTFATDAEAGHSLSWNSPNLTLNSVSGASLGSVNLNTGLATDSEAAHSLENSSGFLLALKSISGATLSSVNIFDMLADAFGRKLEISDTGRLHLETNMGRSISSVSLVGVNDSRYISNASISVSGNTFTITFTDGNGDYKDSVSFTINSPAS